MRLLWYLTRSMTVLNLILITVIVSFGLYIVSPLLGMNVKYTPPPLKKTAEEVGAANSPQKDAPSPLDYSVIAEQNLFHPERKIPVEKVAAPPLPKPEFVLYGTLVTDAASVAYMEDKKVPTSTPGRGKRQTAVKKGETLSGFTLKEVEKDRVMMVRGEETVVVQMNDPATPKTREGAITAPAQPAGQPVPGTPRPPVPQPAAQPVQQPQQAVIHSPATAADSPAPAAPAREPRTPRKSGGLFNLFKR